MYTYLFKSIAKSIGEAIQTGEVNKEWDEKLKHKMDKVAQTCVDAICVYLSNNHLQSCEHLPDSEKNKTGFKPPVYMGQEVKKLIEDLLTQNPELTTESLFKYVPTSTEIKQSGGDRWSFPNPFGAKTKTKPKIDVCQPEKREEYVEEQQKDFLEGRLPKLNRETAKLRNQVIKLEDNIIANKRTINVLEQRNNQPDKVTSLKEKNKKSQTEIEKLNSTITEIDTERFKLANLIRFIRGKIKGNQEDVESYLKQFNKDIQSLENEFNEKNNCKPEDSTEKSNPISVTDVSVTDAASLAMNSNGKLAEVTTEATGAAKQATEAAKQAAKQATEAAENVRLPETIDVGKMSEIGSDAQNTSTEPGKFDVCKPEDRAKYVKVEQSILLKKQNKWHADEILKLEGTIVSAKNMKKQWQDLIDKPTLYEGTVDKRSLEYYGDEVTQINDNIYGWNSRLKEQNELQKYTENLIQTTNGFDKEAELYLSQFRKDTKYLENEYNEKNNCIPVVEATPITDEETSAMGGMGDLSGKIPGMNDMAGMGGLGGKIPEMSSLGKMVDSVTDPRILNQYEIKDGRAGTIAKKFESSVVSKLKCDENTNNYIKEKILDTILRSIRDILITSNKNKVKDIEALLAPIAKQTTRQSMNKHILLIQPTLDIYSKLDTETIIKVLPDYLRLLLELFVYTEYNSITTEQLQLNPIDINKHVVIIKAFYTNEDFKNRITEELNSITEKNIINIFDLNTIEYKKSCKTEEGGNKQDSNVTENVCPKPSEVALKKFKELFEEENKKTSGGRRKNTRKKNKRHRKKRRSTRRFR